MASSKLLIQYVVFDHRSKPSSIETEELVEDRMVLSYVIPVIQEMPSNHNKEFNIFSMSILDLFASAMGAFLIIMIILLPYYLP